jgi:hypothetical protein
MLVNQYYTNIIRPISSAPDSVVRRRSVLGVAR